MKQILFIFVNFSSYSTKHVSKHYWISHNDHFDFHKIHLKESDKVCQWILRNK